MTDKMHKETGDTALDALFADARTVQPDPVSDALRMRLMEDALAAMPRPVAARRGWLARLGAMLADIGGAPGLAGVSAAGLAGVWIGFSGPGMTGDLVSQFWQGAATVSPTVSAWVDDGPLVVTDDLLLSLMSSDLE